MDKLKLLLIALIATVSTAIVVTKFLLIEAEDFWRFLHHLQW